MSDILILEWVFRFEYECWWWSNGLGYRAMGVSDKKNEVGALDVVANGTFGCFDMVFKIVKYWSSNFEGIFGILGYLEW